MHIYIYILYDRWEKIICELKIRTLPLSKQDDTKNDSFNQQPKILDTPEQIKFNDVLYQIKEEQKNVDMRLLSSILFTKSLYKVYSL